MAPLAEPPTSAMTTAPVWTWPDPSPITRCQEGAPPTQDVPGRRRRKGRRDALLAGVCAQRRCLPSGGWSEQGCQGIGRRWPSGQWGWDQRLLPLAGPCGQPGLVAGEAAGRPGGPGDPGNPWPSPFAGSLCVWHFLEQRTGHAGDGILELKPKTWAAQALPAGLPARPPQGGALIKATCDRWGRPRRGPGTAPRWPASRPRCGVRPGSRGAEGELGALPVPRSGTSALVPEPPGTLPLLRLCLRPEGSAGQQVPGSSWASAWRQRK